MNDSAQLSERIRQAYSPEVLAEGGVRLVERLSDHLAGVESRTGRVLNWRDPETNIRDAADELAHPVESTDAATIVDRMDSLFGEILSRGQNLHHPHYVGHQVPASVPLAGWFDAIGSVTNQVMAIYEMGPWATSVEMSLVDAIGRQIGWEADCFAGLVTHGGSIANLTALLTARNVHCPEFWENGFSDQAGKPVLVSHADVHYCVTRAAGILGIGTGNVIRSPLDERRAIDPVELDRLLAELKRQGRPVIAVSACACATPIGAFDPLHRIADVCEKHGVWMHVDAAHGGAAVFSREHRHLVEGIERADSLVLDAHKMMFMPALCAFVFYRTKDHRFEAFRQNAPYLFDPSSPGMAEYDSGMKTLECTKRAATFGLWGTWSCFGPQLFEELVDTTFGLARTFYERLQAADDFTPLHEPECNIQVFRHVPAAMRDASEEEIDRLQLELRRRVIESGEFYLVQNRLDGQSSLRVTLINPLTTPEDLDELLDCLRRTATQLIAETS